MFAPKKILVPTDFSEFSDKALQAALDIAKQHSARIYLFHVVDEVVHRSAGDYVFSDEMVQLIKDNAMAAAKEDLEKQLKKFRVPKEVKVTADIGKGVSYDEILREQKARKTNLIVIASHGRTGLLGHLIGSVAEKVARGATCPVLLVRSPEK
jgi:universal stress protein A